MFRPQCFADRSDRHLVYLDVAEPLSFYLDLMLIGIMVVIALSFAACIASQHWVALTRGLRSLKNSVFPPKASGGSPRSSGENGGVGSGDNASRARRAAGGGGSSPRALTPDNLKSAYREVVRGFHEMV